MPSTVFRFTTVIEPSEFLNEDGLPKQFVFSTIYNRYKNYKGDNPAEIETADTVKTPLGTDKKSSSLNAIQMDDPIRNISLMSGILFRDWF